MKRFVLSLGMFAALCAPLSSSLNAQGLSGDWQASIHGQRVVVHVTEHGPGDYTGMLLQGPNFQGPDTDGFGVSDFSYQPPKVSFSIEGLQLHFEGRVSGADTWTGSWSGESSPVEFHRAGKQDGWRKPTPATVTFRTTLPGVRLEVLDWGGTGKPIVLIPGLGHTAHVYDTFASKLAAKYHVYGITRRGFGESSVPAPRIENYTADAMADDDLAIVAQLKLDRPVFAAHSIGGGELSSIGSRHPEEASGLIYLDAGFSQALYDPADHDLNFNAGELQRLLDQLAVPGGTPAQRKAVVQQVQAGLVPLQEDLQRMAADLHDAPALSAGETAFWPAPVPWSAAAQATMQGMQKFTTIHVPVLAFFANPHNLGPHASEAAKAKDLHTTSEHAALFEQLPGATVVRLPNASHDVFTSNEAEVLQKIDAWMLTLH